VATADAPAHPAPNIQPRYDAAIIRDDGHWVVRLADPELSVTVERLGYRNVNAESAVRATLVDRFGAPPDVRVVATLKSPQLPYEGVVQPSRPVDRRLGKNASWYLAYPGVLERVTCGDFTVGELVRAHETLPFDDVVVVVTWELMEFDRSTDPPPHWLAGHAHLYLDAKGIYLVRQDTFPEEPMAATGHGTPRLWLPVITHDELADRIAAATGS
jgi:hypothetical protein